jgi:AbrB family looped-hinge helix DNA binding protein
MQDLVDGRIFLPEAAVAATAPIVEFLASTTIGEKGQLTVPKQFRDDLHLKPGAPVAILRMGDGLILIPEQERFEKLCKRVSEAMLGSGVTPESVLETLPEVRKQIYEERYGAIAAGGKSRRPFKARRAK